MIGICYNVMIDMYFVEIIIVKIAKYSLLFSFSIVMLVLL